MFFTQPQDNIFKFTENLYGLPDNDLTLKDLATERHIQLYRDALLSADSEKDIRLTDLEQAYQLSLGVFDSEWLMPRDEDIDKPLPVRINSFTRAGQPVPPELLLAFEDYTTSVLESEDSSLTMDRLLIPNTEKSLNSYRKKLHKSWMFRNFKHIYTLQKILNERWGDKWDKDRTNNVEKFIKDTKDRKTPDTFLRGFDYHEAKKK